MEDKKRAIYSVADISATPTEPESADESFKRPGSIPFKWEIKPGTPKPQKLNHSPQRPLPKLSPPPSYALSSRQSTNYLPCHASPISQGCFPIQSHKSKEAHLSSRLTSLHHSNSAQCLSSLSSSFSKLRAKEDVNMVAQWLL